MRIIGDESLAQNEAQQLIIHSWTHHPLDNLADLASLSVVQIFKFKSLDAVLSPRNIKHYQEAINQILPKIQKKNPAIYSSIIESFKPANCSSEIMKKTKRPHNILNWISLVILLLRWAWLLMMRRWDPMANYFVIFLISNAMVCSFFSGPFDRYQGRIMALPLIYLIIFGLNSAENLWPKIKSNFRAKPEPIS